VIVGAGQAGIEAALASARMGRATLCVTLRLDRIGYLPCNCSIGGPAKGQIAREVDALGGAMMSTTDRALTHLRRVGTGKGPAVQTVRAQVCKDLYPALMRETLEQVENLELMEGQVESLILSPIGVEGVRVRTATGVEEIASRAVVITTGTFLNGLCHEGEIKTVAARKGDDAVTLLADQLRNAGIRMQRFKTGTTPRVRKGSLDLDRMGVMPSEPDAGPCSFGNDAIQPVGELLPCWQTHTTEATHAVLKNNLSRSAMYGGHIDGVGPRFCPSVEDKIVRFADKSTHPVFLEQEYWTRDLMYVQGFSTSMPAEVQLEALHHIPGMEEAEIEVPGYAVEYDVADPTQLELSLMSKLLPGAFLAGQLNGTSGYEEAAGQGIVAGLNAALYASGDPECTFSRSSSFIGVMIHDLVTKGVDDPYRMLTSRAEFRLLLRHDNADQRLTPLGRSLGLIGDDRWNRYTEKKSAIEQGIAWLLSEKVSPTELEGQVELAQVSTLHQVLSRPEVRLDDLEATLVRRGRQVLLSQKPEVRAQLELDAKYSGYIQIQAKQAERLDRLEGQRIPLDFVWEDVGGLSHESREKLSRLRPTTVGQAAQVPGVRPADIMVLLGFLKQRPTQDKATREPITQS